MDVQTVLQKVYEKAYRDACVVNRKDGSILVKVPAGEFEMGDGKEGNCPKHRVYLDEYYIGVYCITNRQYKRFVDETGHRPLGPFGLQSGCTNLEREGVSEGKSRPSGGVCKLG